MSEQVYGVCFDDEGATYLVAFFDEMSEAERDMERREEERFEEQQPEGEYEPVYEVVELERETVEDDDVQDQLERGFAVRIS
jgi:hypothetical protein